jgi:hypothetical protein
MSLGLGLYSDPYSPRQTRRTKPSTRVFVRFVRRKLGIGSYKAKLAARNILTMPESFVVWLRRTPPRRDLIGLCAIDITLHPSPPNPQSLAELKAWCASHLNHRHDEWKVLHVWKRYLRETRQMQPRGRRVVRVFSP